MLEEDRGTPTESCGFDRLNLHDLELVPVCAHSGSGLVSFARVAGSRDLSGACNFIDYVSLPPGTSIGEHRHRHDEEEFYLVLEGTGEMQRGGEVFRVRAGDLIRNAPGGCHGLVNDGQEDLRVFVFELTTRP
jgi:mannose-6-phosphate isomerase-like protein (cupin superfamily)